MIAIKPFAEILDADIGKDVLKKIEVVGRTCYKSTENITDDSAPKFVSNLIKRGHEAMLEHASFCFLMEPMRFVELQIAINSLERFGFKSFLRFTCDFHVYERPLVSGNVRAWRDFMKAFKSEYHTLPNYMKSFVYENPILFPEYQDPKNFSNSLTGSFVPFYIEDLKTKREFLTHCDVTVRFVVDRGISHELVRHRVASFAQESTRYCNYSKDKFGSQLTFIIPEFFSFGSKEWCLWKNHMERCELDYLTLIGIGVTPEKARTILPNSLKTEVIMTANCSEWKHFFGLRACNSTGKAHPQMLEVSRPLLDDFKNTIGIIFDDLVYGE